MDCPLCDGKIVEKKTRKGKLFYGCNHYPKCKFASWYKPVDEKCPKCDNYLIEKNGKIVLFCVVILTVIGIYEVYRLTLRKRRCNGAFHSYA